MPQRGEEHEARGQQHSPAGPVRRDTTAGKTSKKKSAKSKVWNGTAERQRTFRFMRS